MSLLSAWSISLDSTLSHKSLLEKQKLKFKYVNLGQFPYSWIRSTGFGSWSRTADWMLIHADLDPQRSRFTLKGQCHEIFDFCFFSWISFPLAPEYTMKVVSNFFKYTWRFSQLKVCHRCQRHRWQMQKIFNRKSFNYLVWTPLGSKVNLYKHFCLQVHFKVSAAWYCSHYLPPVANLPPVSLIH